MASLEAPQIVVDSSVRGWRGFQRLSGGRGGWWSLSGDVWIKYKFCMQFVDRDTIISSTRLFYSASRAQGVQAVARRI